MAENLNLVWLAVCTALVFFMQAGFALVEGGLMRAKNSVNVIMKVYLGTCIAGVLFWSVGYGLTFGKSLGGLIGGSGFFPSGMTAMEGVTLLYQLMFATIAVTIVSGAAAERIRYSAYLAFAALMVVFIYPVYAHWAWNPDGWLNKLGFIDLAGGGAIHAVGAWASLACVIVLGPRLGRFSKSGQARDIPGHNLPMVALGGIILWMGWLGFNGGSIIGVDKANLGDVLLTTYLGGCAGGLGALVFMKLTGRQILATGAVNGSLCGLASMTAGAASVAPGSALLIGFVGGMGCIWLSEKLRSFRLDDPVDAIAVHGWGGVWGLLAAGAFYAGGLFDPSRISVQVLGIVVSFLWAFPMAFAFFKLLDMTMGIRAPTLHEQRGLDYTEHHEVAYPEFQESPGQLLKAGN